MAGRRASLKSIEALRAVAASAVVVHHVLFMLIHNGGYSFVVWESGAAGVDLFFCISGFVMMYAHADDFETPHAARSFLLRRVIRVVPLYWLVTTLVVAGLWFVPQAFPNLKFDWLNVILSYVFLLSRTTSGDITTVVSVGWTLCFEAYFYAIFAVLLNWPRRYFLFAAAAIFASGILVGFSGLPIPPPATVAVRPLVLEFLFGVVIGLVFLKGKTLPFLLSIPLVIGSAIVLAISAPSDDWRRLAMWGLPCAIILAVGLSWERSGLRVPKWLIALGASSYSLYLVHHLVISLVGKLWSFFKLSYLPPVVLGIIAFVAALVVAHVTYLWVERPLIDWLRLRFLKRPKSVTVVSTGTATDSLLFEQAPPLSKQPQN
jgi:exopolysaccharide production protein ExoZ